MLFSEDLSQTDALVVCLVVQSCIFIRAGPTRLSHQFRHYVPTKNTVSGCSSRPFISRIGSTESTRTDFRPVRQ